MLKKRLRLNPWARNLKDIAIVLSKMFDSNSKSIANFCTIYGVNSIIDVGANSGQFGIDMRRGGYRQDIFSFEPVTETFHALAKTTRRDVSWNAVNLALGSSKGFSKINISKNSGLSSSILSMNSLHLENFPDSEFIDTELVQVSTVDDQIRILGIRPETSMLKMDVQGYEYEVLKGAVNNLGKFKFCYLELSIQPLYNGEATFLSVLNFLSSHGQVVLSIYRGVSGKNGQLLQVDVLTTSNLD